MPVGLQPVFVTSYVSALTLRDGTLHTKVGNAMLLNEFLKEHKKVQDQGATIARQQKQIEALTVGVQKVSAQLEVSRPEPRTVLNNH